MRKPVILETFLSAIHDPERQLTERLYLALNLYSEFMVFIALVGDIITQENPKEIAVLVGTLIFVPTIGYVCLKKNKMDFAIKATVLGLVFVILPSLFFFGGGAEGGAVLWIIFSFTYVGLVLKGRWRTGMIIVLTIESLALYIIEYYYPQFVDRHNRKMFYVDAVISIILVGFICYVMTKLQNRFFKAENMRAKEAAKKAEELTRAQNRFFSGMSHEIRTPINSILGLNELILRDQSASDEIVKDATGIQGSGKMLLALINDILDFSKMEAGSMDIVPVDYKVGEMLSEIVNMIWIRANDKGLKLNVSIDPKVPSVLYGDEVRIKQIIINLLNNAVKYTQEGSVELHVESEQKDEKTVELSVSVSDTGMGIKKETVPYLFDAFKRVDEEKNRHIEGTGLGLSIVKQLVELMGGTITVNSIYGEGSTFTFVVTQGISDNTQIGELSIHNQGLVNRKTYESSFRAPDARVLIVDDNETNLEVESKLLTDTEMAIDTVVSGKEALNAALKERYDIILMDHLMPEMDGIECLEQIRNQVGGLNRTTPVVVLTANAGSENRELYNRSGFDGHLIKPVSGEALENAIMRYITPEKLIVNSNKMMTSQEDINAAAGYSGKLPVLITSTSMCDLPVVLTKSIIPVLPFLIKTEDGVFKDGIQLGADELVRYIVSGKNAQSMPPDETAYMDFFASELRRAHHIIHIAITDSMSEDYNKAVEAAKSFDNVTVINSECISSATGILVLIAVKLAQLNESVDEIVEEINMVKKRLQCSFVVDSTEYMARKGLLRPAVDRVARALMLHPSIVVKDNKTGVGGFWIGKSRRAYKKYISKAFPVDVIPDPEVVFITYTDVPIETLLWVKEEISKIAYFENVVFQQASAAISTNCGPGSFGILYFIKSNKSYNLGSFLKGLKLDLESSDEVTESADINDEEELEESDATQDESPDNEESGQSEAAVNVTKEPAIPSKWYETLEGVDPEIAIKNSGSEDAFKTVLKIFYDSIDGKASELIGYYDNGNWQNYTIKVHALKSSAKLIGAMETAEEAQQLENAGKEGNIEYIKEHHESFMQKYLKYKDVLDPIFAQEKAAENNKDEDKPVADDFLMESVYEGLLDAAENMDCDAIDEILKEVEDYAIPEKEKEKFNALCEMAGAFDYDGIVERLKEGV